MLFNDNCFKKDIEFPIKVMAKTTKNTPNTKEMIQ